MEKDQAGCAEVSGGCKSSISDGKSSRTAWMPEEDRKLREFVMVNGRKGWAKIASALEGRTGKQCRNRWYHVLDPDLSGDEWTEEEEQILVDMHRKFGKRWAILSKYIEGRTENAIKNHWHSVNRCKQDQRTVLTKPRSNILRNYQLELERTDGSSLSGLTPSASEGDLPLSAPPEITPEVAALFPAAAEVFSAGHSDPLPAKRKAGDINRSFESTLEQAGGKRVEAPEGSQTSVQPPLKRGRAGEAMLGENDFLSGEQLWQRRNVGQGGRAPPLGLGNEVEFDDIMSMPKGPRERGPEKGAENSGGAFKDYFGFRGGDKDDRSDDERRGVRRGLNDEDDEDGMPSRADIDYDWGKVPKSSPSTRGPPNWGGTRDNFRREGPSAAGEEGTWSKTFVPSGDMPRFGREDAKEAEAMSRERNRNVDIMMHASHANITINRSQGTTIPEEETDFEKYLSEQSKEEKVGEEEPKAPGGNPRREAASVVSWDSGDIIGNFSQVRNSGVKLHKTMLFNTLPASGTALSQAPPSHDSMLQEGTKIVAYYADAENQDEISRHLHSELELVIPNTSDYDLEVASLASIVVYLGIIRAAPQSKLGHLLDALTRVSSAPKFTLSITRDPEADCDREVFEAKRQGNLWAFFRVRDCPKIDRLIYVSVQPGQAGEDVEDCLFVHGSKLHSGLQFELRWRIGGSRGRLLPSNLIHPNVFQDPARQILINEPESVAIDLPTLEERVEGVLYLECWRGVTPVGNQVPVNLSIFQIAQDAAREHLRLDASPCPQNSEAIGRGERLWGNSRLEVEKLAGLSPAYDRPTMSPDERLVDQWQSSWKHDVFISHAGEDKPFAHHLRNLFTEIGLKAFVDQDDLAGGAPADLQMLTAVKEAPIGIALFGKHFFQKEWPIRELKEIVGKTVLLPVLYKLTYEESQDALSKSPQANAADPVQWQRFCRTTLRTTAVKNPSTGQDDLPFLQLIVFSAISLAVKEVVPDVAHSSPNEVFAFAFVEKLERAALRLSKRFKKLTVEQLEEALTWRTSMRARADEMKTPRA